MVMLKMIAGLSLPKKRKRKINGKSSNKKDPFVQFQKVFIKSLSNSVNLSEKQLLKKYKTPGTVTVQFDMKPFRESAKRLLALHSRIIEEFFVKEGLPVHLAKDVEYISPQMGEIRLTSAERGMSKPIDVKAIIVDEIRMPTPSTHFELTSAPYNRIDLKRGELLVLKPISISTKEEKNV
jgi:hypothetical protein